MTQFSTKVQKLNFCPFLGPFGPKSREREFSQVWDLRRKLANHNTLHFRSFLAKTNDSILRKSKKKAYFCQFLDPFLHFLGKWKFFPEKSGSISFVPLWIRDFMQKIRKIILANPEKHALQTYEQMDEQTRVHL